MTEQALNVFHTCAVQSGSATKGTSGSFEVSVNGQLVHSKLGGAGYVDEAAKWDALSKAIEAAK